MSQTLSPLPTWGISSRAHPSPVIPHAPHAESCTPRAVTRWMTSTMYICQRRNLTRLCSWFAPTQNVSTTRHVRASFTMPVTSFHLRVRRNTITEKESPLYVLVNMTAPPPPHGESSCSGLRAALKRITGQKRQWLSRCPQGGWGCWYFKRQCLWKSVNETEQDAIGVEVFTNAIGDAEIVQKLLEQQPRTLARICLNCSSALRKP